MASESASDASLRCVEAGDLVPCASPTPQVYYITLFTRPPPLPLPDLQATSHLKLALLTWRPSATASSQNLPLLPCFFHTEGYELTFLLPPQDVLWCDEGEESCRYLHVTWRKSDDDVWHFAVTRQQGLKEELCKCFRCSFSSFYLQTDLCPHCNHSLILRSWPLCCRHFH